MTRWLTGWTCPKCQRVVSAAYTECPYCTVATGSQHAPTPVHEPMASEPGRAGNSENVGPETADASQVSFSNAQTPPPSRLSAIDTISLAFARTKREMFQPFRLGRWARLAFVSLITGEFLSTGAGGLGSGGNFNIPRRGGEGSLTLEGLAWLDTSAWMSDLKSVILICIAAVGIVLGFALLWAYAACVYRFILFDAVLRDHCELREGWRSWRQQGRRFLGWQIGFALVAFSVLAVTIGVPLLLAAGMGLFREPDRHLALLISGGAVLFLLVILVVLLSSLVSVLANDFVVPIMAVEKCGVIKAWRMLLALIEAEKKAYAGYVLMKIVLAVGIALLLGIVNFVVVLLPIMILGFIVILAPLPNVHWNALTISAAIVAAVMALSALFTLVCFISAPAMVFFQSYAMHFFGSRYSALRSKLYATTVSSAAPS